VGDELFQLVEGAGADAPCAPPPAISALICGKVRRLSCCNWRMARIALTWVSL
jgi:hypothetical protein